jgi:hypothetical protein
MAAMKSKAMLKKGLKTQIPPPPSKKASGANINSDALRKGPAATPKSLGGRTA